MKTKKNYKGEQFDVTYDKLFYTSDGMGFILKREEDVEPRVKEIFRVDVHNHLAKIDCAIFFKFHPRGEYELEYIPFESDGRVVEEIYSMIEKGDCT